LFDFIFLSLIAYILLYLFFQKNDNNIEEVPLPEIKPIEGIDLYIEEGCKEKCQRCLKDWKWKWIIIFLIIIGLMILAIILLIDEHNRIDEEINSRTYRLDDVDYCKLNPGIAKKPWVSPNILWMN
jgi:hypothetical protein